MRLGALLIGLLLVGGVGQLLGHGTSPSGQAQEATPAPAQWHIAIVDLYLGNGDHEATQELINAELATFDQHCIAGVDFFGLGRDEAPSLAVILRC
jgi:hypothetical protein